jgi:hypothetical protein
MEAEKKKALINAIIFSGGIIGLLILFVFSIILHKGVIISTLLVIFIVLYSRLLVGSIKNYIKT